MIILDTNVVSEAMKPAGDQRVVSWLNAQAVSDVYLTSITLAELMFGIGILADGRRKMALSAALDEIAELFRGRILAFDDDAARHFADLAVTARRSGRGFPLPDGYIAAIAVANGFPVVTRDLSAFEGAGVTAIDPWTDRRA